MDAIIDLISSGANVTIAVKASDLKKAVEQICDARDKKVAAELAADAVRRKKEFTLTREDVTARLCVSKSTLERWHKSGYLRGRKVGAVVRYCEADVDRILQVGTK